MSGQCFAPHREWTELRATEPPAEGELLPDYEQLSKNERQYRPEIQRAEPAPHRINRSGGLTNRPFGSQSERCYRNAEVSGGFVTVTLKKPEVAAISQLCYLDVTARNRESTKMSSQDQFSKQIEVLVSSHTLHGSESLCKLLRYLAHHALKDPNGRVKEYQIATEVFGRRPDFDPQSDSMIRVQAGRLRAKLSEYYSGEGANDAVIVELPKGTYHLQFHHRAAADGKERNASPSGVAPAIAPPEPMVVSAPYWKVVAIGLGILLVVAIAIISSLLTSRKLSPTVLAGVSEPTPVEFQELWKPFLRGSQEPWLIFSNAPFIGRPETGMRYYNPSRDGGGEVWDHYTGVGEVLAVHELDQVFSTLQRRIRVKRGSLFSIDDVRNNDLIFLGSPAENLTLTEIPNTRAFVFRRVTDGARKGDLSIVNVSPRAGEPASVVASPSGQPLTEDYAVIALMPGLDPARSVIIFAGTTTFGTQGAVEYACHAHSVIQLMSHLAIGTNGEVKPFEALVRVKVTHGVPVDTELVAVRQ